MDKLSAALSSIAVNLVLLSVKVAAGVMTGSIGILAEVLHSAFDLIASFLAFLGIHKAQSPPDQTHPYGHEKFENLSSLLQTILIAVTAVWVGYEAVTRLLHPVPIAATEIGLAVMVFAFAVDWFFSRFLHDVSVKEASVALEADAYHFTSDLWSTGAVIFGLLAALVGFPAVDSLAGLAVAVLMVKLSIELGSKALFVLLDHGASTDELERIAAVISKVRGVKGYHKLRARHMGARLVVDLDIQLEPSLSLKKAHVVSHRLKTKIASEMPIVKEVIVHIEPYEGK